MSLHNAIDTAAWNRGSYFHLLGLLLIVLFILPLTPEKISTSIVLDMLFSLIMMVGVHSLWINRKVFWTGLALMVPALSLRWFAYFMNSSMIEGFAEIASSLFLFFNLMIIVAHLLEEKSISINTIYGGIVAYLLIALSFSTLYNGIFIFNNQAFLFNGALETIGKAIDEQIFGDFTYYSLITLSTVGYGEITPYSAFARFAAAFQGILGQLYLTIFLARLVGLHIAQHQND